MRVISEPLLLVISMLRSVVGALVRELSNTAGPQDGSDGATAVAVGVNVFVGVKLGVGVKLDVGVKVAVGVFV